MDKHVLSFNTERVCFSFALRLSSFLERQKKQFRSNETLWSSQIKVKFIGEHSIHTSIYAIHDRLQWGDAVE